MQSVGGVLYEEALSKSVIITDTQVIPESLLELRNVIQVAKLEPHQEALRQDVITCLKAKAYRPAIVIAWALGFDLLRWWVHSDASRLADFNQELQKKTHSKGQRQIIHYQDFFAENEAFVLQVLRDATASLQGFTGKTHRLFENLLDDRNAFAHANFANATEGESHSYIERIIRVLTNAMST